MQTEYKGYYNHGKLVLSCPRCRKALITVFDVGGENAKSEKIVAKCGICGSQSEPYESVGDIKLSIGDNGVSDDFDTIDMGETYDKDGISIVTAVRKE